MATEVTSTAGWLISLTRGTIATQASTAAMITTMERTMLRRLPKPRLAAGCCTAGAAAVSGALVEFTLPILADCRRYGEVWRATGVLGRHEAHPTDRVIWRPPLSR